MVQSVSRLPAQVVAGFHTGDEACAAFPSPLWKTATTRRMKPPGLIVPPPKPRAWGWLQAAIQTCAGQEASIRIGWILRSLR